MPTLPTPRPPNSGESWRHQSPSARARAQAVEHGKRDVLMRVPGGGVGLQRQDVVGDEGRDAVAEVGQFGGMVKSMSPHSPDTRCPPSTAMTAPVM
jgi:hypothetical protein